MKYPPVFVVITLICTLTLSAAAQDDQWSLNKGDNIIEATSMGIHVKQRDAKDTNAFALARKKLNFAAKSPWRVAFDVRYGQIQPVASTVKLGIGDALIGAVAADAKGMDVYLGNDTTKLVQPTDSEWHHFEFICDGATTSVWHNGVKLHEEPTQGTPDTLIVGAWSEGKWLSRQGELWMRSLEVSTPGLSSLLPSSPPEAVPTPDAIVSHPVMNFAGDFNTAILTRETDTPQHPMDLTVTTATLSGQTTGVLHVRLPSLADHDVLRSELYTDSPTTSDGAKTVLWARGDAHTPALMVEWDERDGTRWIATFPITEQWRRVVLSAKDFAPWLVAADRARSGFHPSQEVRLKMGLDASNSHTAPGLHEYWVAQIGVESPPSVVTPAASLVPLPVFSADAVTIPLRPTDTSVTCLVGDRLQIAGSVTMQNTFDTCLLVADGVVASTRTPSIPTDNYSFTWTPKTPGTHTLELRYTNFHAKVTARRLLVTAEDSPPAVLAGLPTTAGADTAVAVVGAGPRPFPLARVDFYFNNKPLAVTTSAPFATTLPIAATTKSGTYPVKFIAYDSSGRPFYAHASKIEVPQRVQVTAPRTFTLRNAGDKASLTASILPGIKIAKVSYTIAHANSTDYQVVADATAAPFSAAMDLSSRASGDYWVNAIVTSAAGNVYEAWAVPLALTNVPDDNRQVQESKNRAAEEEKAAAAAAAIAAENAKWNADSLSSSVLDANADAAYRKGSIKVSLVDDPAKIGTDYYVTVRIQNLGDTPIHIFPPSILFDDFSSVTLYPTEQDAADVIFVNINSRGNRQVQLKAHISSADISSSRKPIRIKFLSMGVPVLSLPL